MGRGAVVPFVELLGGHVPRQQSSRRGNGVFDTEDATDNNRHLNARSPVPLLWRADS